MACTSLCNYNTTCTKPLHQRILVTASDCDSDICIRGQVFISAAKGCRKVAPQRWSHFRSRARVKRSNGGYPFHSLEDVNNLAGRRRRSAKLPIEWKTQQWRLTTAPEASSTVALAQWQPLRAIVPCLQWSAHRLPPSPLHMRELAEAAACSDDHPQRSLSAVWLKDHLQPPTAGPARAATASTSGSAGRTAHKRPSEASSRVANSSTTRCWYAGSAMKPPCPAVGWTSTFAGLRAFRSWACATDTTRLSTATVNGEVRSSQTAHI